MTLNQSHTGSGPNIGRDLISVSQAISVDSLIGIVNNLMYQAATNNFKVVLETIETYRKLSLSEEVENLFNILTSYIDSLEKNTAIDVSLLKAELNNRDNLKFIDLYRAILIKSIAKTSVEKAEEAYISFYEDSKLYLLSVFDQNFASREELQNRFDSKLFSLDDYSLFYLALGFWRVHDYKSSNITFQNISTTGRNETIQYWLIATQLNSIVYSNETQLSYPDQKTSREIVELTNSFVKLISGKLSLSSLATSILVALVKLTMSNVYLPEIRDIGLKYRRDIKKIDEKLGETLHRIAEKETFEAPDWLILKLSDNQVLNEEEIDTLIRVILFKNIDLTIVKKWLIESNISSLCEKFYNDFLKVYLLSFMKFKDVFEENEYRVNLNNFLNEHTSSLKGINSITIKHWCDNLYCLGAQFEISIYKILEAVCIELAVNTDLNYYYLQSLLRLDKLTTMRRELDRIGDDEWCHDLYLFQARYYSRTKNYKEAQKAYLKFIKNEKNIHVWHGYLESCMEGGENIKLAKEQLYHIPVSLFSPENIAFQSFIFQVAHFIDFNFAEKIIFKLFIENPTNNASITTKFYFNCVVNQNNNSEKEFEGIHFGVVYKVRDKVNTALVVDNELAKHKELIGIQSELGQIFVDSTEGHEVQYNFNKVTFLNYQPINTTIYQLAIQIVSDLQHNYDEPIFYQPEINEETFLEDTIKTLQFSKSQNSIEKSVGELIKNQDLSLYTKGRLIIEKRLPSEEVEIAYNLLLNKNANQCLTKAGGNIDEADAVVIDIYGAVYLCITNIYKSIIAFGLSIYVSNETVNAIRQWIDNVTSDKFLMINEFEGQLFKTDASSIRVTHGSLIDALNQLMSYVKVEPEIIFDLPTFASEMKRLVSDSVFSSVKLSLSLDIPWLCLDSLIRTILTSSMDFKVLNIQSFVRNNISNEHTTFEDRREAIIYSAFSGLYTEYYLADLITLAKDIKDFPILNQLLSDTIIEFQDSQATVVFLVQMIKHVIQTGIKIKFFKKEAYGKNYLSLSVKINMNGTQGNLIQEIMIASILYVCLDKATKIIEGLSVEERLAKIVINFEKLYLDKLCSKYFYSILESFVESRFLRVEDVIQEIEELKV